jgi:threonine/homoserine/homoserine lactone efflux protein
VTPLRAIRDGFVVGVANPKTIVFFIVALPAFTSSAPGHLPVQAQMLILGALFPVIALVLDSARATTAGTARQWLVRSPRRLALIGGAGGLVMIGLGISVAVTGRKD